MACADELYSFQSDYNLSETEHAHFFFPKQSEKFLKNDISVANHNTQQNNSDLSESHPMVKKFVVTKSEDITDRNM